MTTEEYKQLEQEILEMRAAIQKLVDVVTEFLEEN